MSKKSQDALSKGLTEAERKARIRDIENENKKFDDMTPEERNFVLGIVTNVLGDDYYLGKKKKKNSSIAFAQVIQPNIQVLVRSGYLTMAEKSFLIDISSYVDFRTNVIVQREFDSKNVGPRKKRDKLPPVANIKFISELVGIHRTSASRLMNSLRKKGIIATAETGMKTEDGRTCTSRTWFVNPNVMYCGDKEDIDETVRFIFRNSLRNIKGKDGKKISLPVDLFMEE
ncbi:hypothetical protein A3863_07890 [Priestia endophytica]|uniref:helix-turn-helix domain-containing protein n=1 Tax=Priestia endophytica TaxID=135735 RepID=UPI000DCA60BF|nr:helix-turn-helix domain-containing protein [Priestia endophytica]RAS90780.1 hypothetical protein A3863_07885 [Priestia endophytica]RAS90781.1 hypothetical protein A3863_07890 [Priestia endophytica]